jgi:hypothetical protein
MKNLKNFRYWQIYEHINSKLDIDIDRSIIDLHLLIIICQHLIRLLFTNIHPLLLTHRLHPFRMPPLLWERWARKWGRVTGGCSWRKLEASQLSDMVWRWLVIYKILHQLVLVVIIKYYQLINWHLTIWTIVAYCECLSRTSLDIRCTWL